MCCDERPTLRLVLTGQNASEYVTLAEDDYSRWEPFVQIGGPIVRDRLWFYGGYTPQLDDTNRTVTFRSNSQTSTLQVEREDALPDGQHHGAAHRQRCARRFAARYSEYEQDGPAAGEGRLEQLPDELRRASAASSRTSRPAARSTTSPATTSS